ncbi:MAG: HGGxSTG domain-containing protein [Candidatus Thermoplasmatota archaeon]|nr:HGGxSTG domain-containing protein [Candidatus Thermoplasmatota archaeon]
MENDLKENTRAVEKKYPHGWLKSGGTPCDIRALPKCQAKAKSTGKRCGNIAMKGKRVCHIHGGKSPGAAQGNKNALKHGLYTREAQENRAIIKALVRLAKDSLAEI